MLHIIEPQNPNHLDFHFVNKWNVSSPYFLINIQVLKLKLHFFFQKLSFIWEKAIVWCLETKEKE